MKTLLLIGCLVLTGGILAGGVWFLSQKIPPASAQLAPNKTPLVVTITEPGEGETFPAGSAVTVHVEAIAVDSITKVELWVDGILVRSEMAASYEQQYANKYMIWDMPAPGTHTLVARALDSKGRAAYSNVVHAASNAPKGSQALVTTQSGDTLEAIAKRYNVPAAAVQIDGSASAASNQPLTVGTQLVVDLPPPPLPATSQNAPEPPPQGNTDEPSSDSTTGIGLWLDENITSKVNPSQAPAAPLVSFSIASCQPKLYITDNSGNEQGFFVYRSEEDQTTFDRIATLGAHSGGQSIEYVQPALSGTTEYYISAFNSGGESASNVVQVAADVKSCAPGKEGAQAIATDVPLTNLVKFDPQTIDALYLYLSTGNNEWHRVPLESDAFLYPRQQELKLGNLLPPQVAQTDSNVQGEVWGWKQGKLVLLGSFERQLPKAMSLTLPGRKIAKTTLDVCQDLPDGACAWVKLWGMTNWLSRKFQWSTTSEIDGGLWQVATQPFDTALSLNPPGLVLTGPTDSGLQFFVDFSLLAPEPPKKSNPANGQLNPNLKTQPDSPTKSVQSSLTGPFNLATVLGGGVSKSGSASNFVTIGQVFLPPDMPLATYYVRVIPMKGGMVSGQPSNTVVINIVKPNTPDIEIPEMPPEFQTPLYDIEILKYSPPIFEDPNKWGCITIVGYTKDADWMTKGAWPTGDRCPDPFLGGSNQGLGGLWDDLTSGAAKIMNWASKTWNDLKNLAANLMLKFTPIGWQCQLAENVALPEGTCKKMMDTAVNAGLVAMGIPPTIPNFDQLMNEGVDYVTELAVQEALEQVPACAGTPCEDAVRKTIHDTLKQAADEALGSNSFAQGCAGEQESHMHGKEVLCPPPGVIARPQPGAVYQPPTVELKVTRIKDVPEPSNPVSCTLGANVQMDYHFAGGTVYGPWVDSPTMEAKPQDVVGVPYKGASIRIPKLKPGESKQVTLALTQWNVPYVFPWHLEYSNKFHTVLSEDFKIMDWYTLVQEGQPTIGAGASFNDVPGYVYGYLAPCAVTKTVQPK